MIKAIKLFVKLSPSRQKILIQTFGLSVYSFFLFRFFNKWARLGKRVESVTNHQSSNKKMNDIAWAIHAVAKRAPWKNVCRHQAYQAKWLCNYYKISCFIFIGFKKGEAKNEIQAHAWTVVNDHIITGFCNPEEYTVQSIYKNKW